MNIPSVELYIPVHKRVSSFASKWSNPGGSSSDSRYTYSIATLLNLSGSPLARLTPSTREALRATFPELMTNRKQRKTMERNNAQAPSQVFAPIITQSNPRDNPLSHTAKSSKHRANLRRKKPMDHKRSVKAVDEAIASWRVHERVQPARFARPAPAVL